MNILFIICLSFSLFIFLINIYIEYGNMKKWHAASLVPMVGGLWACICAYVFLPDQWKWISPSFLIFDLSVLMLIASFFERGWDDIRDQSVKNLVKDLVNNKLENVSVSNIVKEYEILYGSKLSLPPDHTFKKNNYFAENTWKEFSGIQHSVVTLKMWFDGVERNCMLKIHVQKDGEKISAWIEGVDDS